MTTSPASDQLQQPKSLTTHTGDEDRDTPVRVLHVGTAPFARTVREGLRAVGVEVEVMTPDDIDDVLMPNVLEAAERPITPEARQAIARRLAEADVCVLDEGTGPRLATLLLSLRQAHELKNITTIEMVSDIACGLEMKNALVGPDWEMCELVNRKNLLDHLRRLGRPHRIPAPPASITIAPTRAPRPLPYALNPATYTWLDSAAGASQVPVDMRRVGGNLCLQELLAPGSADEWGNIDAYAALTSLICHLPVEDLPLLGTPEAAWWWNRLFEQVNEGDPPPREDWLHISPQREALDTILWHALARDGGRDTLAALPPIFLEPREYVTNFWPDELKGLADRMPLEFVSAEANTRYNSTGVAVLKQWDVVPCEDPLGPDADPSMYRPTLMTLRVARRYRTAPEVIRQSHARWGGRPYLETETANQLTQFVGESYPSSEEELEEWIRVLRTLPAGRLRKFMCRGMNLWPRIELPLAEAWPAEAEIAFNGYAVPIWDERNRPIGLVTGQRHPTESIERLLRALEGQNVITRRRLEPADPRR